ERQASPACWMNQQSRRSKHPSPQRNRRMSQNNPNLNQQGPKVSPSLLASLAEAKQMDMNFGKESPTASPSSTNPGSAPAGLVTPSESSKRTRITGST